MNWPPQRDSKADISSVSPSSERIDEGLTLDTLAFGSLYGGQFTFINQVDKIKPNYLRIVDSLEIFQSPPSLMHHCVQMLRSNPTCFTLYPAFALVSINMTFNSFAFLSPSSVVTCLVKKKTSQNNV